MPTAQANLNRMLREDIAPTLRAHGFAGSGQNFHRQIDGNWAAINVQRDRYSTSTELRFTINLGTASTAVLLEDGHPADEPAREVDCHWRIRMGDLMPKPRDTWWTVRSKVLAADLDRLGGTIGSHLADLAVPALERMASDEAILGSYLDGEPTTGLTPAAMDVIGPILRWLGPPDRFERYLAVVDAEGERSASLYTMFDEFPTANLGPTRIARRLEKLSAERFEPRQQAIVDLGYAPPSEAIRAAIRPALDDANPYIRFSAAQALGRLGDVAVVARLEEMVTGEAARMVAVHAAFALARLDGVIRPEDRSGIRDVIARRRDRAVGHDRAALSHLLRTLA